MSQCPHCGEPLISISIYHDTHEYYCIECKLTVSVTQLEPEEIKQLEDSLSSKLDDEEDDLLW